MHKNLLPQKYVVAMCIGCVQAGHNYTDTARINTEDTHRPLHTKHQAVYKPRLYTPLSVQTPSNKPLTYALLFEPFYRLSRLVIPTIHRAYIYDKKLPLMNI